MDIIETTNEENMNVHIIDDNISNTSDDDIDNKKYNRYKKIINNLGLNININYPLNIIVDGIIELHTIPVGNIYVSFCDNDISQKIRKNIFGNELMQNKFIKYTKYYIKRSVKIAFKNYLYNTIYKNNKNVIDKVDTLGFNYNNPRWSKLSSYAIE